ncbi:Phosphoenolpyruvate-protein phosphotransferase [termite gut metagenome]|uniref:Phosphoenolpyruvate-protein phosphotransferase n=1 Tax=termite gut metagenome TaxID=433724 RepID=A0A5J4RLQ4_9ZZZZ
MVGFVLISHSRALAEATLVLVQAMSGTEVPIAIAAGSGTNHQELGTDAMEILDAITTVLATGEAAVLLMDMGSALLSAEMALDFLDDEAKGKVRLCSAPFVEGAVAATVAAKIGGSIDDVLREASAALSQKSGHLALAEAAPAPVVVTVPQDMVSVSVRLLMRNGLHARPVAFLVQEAAKSTYDIQIRNLTNGKGPVSLKSITSVMSLEALYGHEVALSASDDSAMAVLASLRESIEQGLGDAIVAEALTPTISSVNTPQHVQEEKVQGKPIGVCRGIVIAPVYYEQPTSFNIPDAPAEDASREITLLQAALSVTADVLHQKAQEVSLSMGEEQGDIFRAQAVLLNDPALMGEACKFIMQQNMQAVKAWWLAISQAVETYRHFSDDNLRQRAGDLQDVARLVLQQMGVDNGADATTQAPCILLTDDITPGQVAALDKDKIKGVICLQNGQTSHSAILLSSRAIPTIVQAQRNAVSLRQLPTSTLMAMDGATGEIWVNPTGALLAEIQQRQATWQHQSAMEKQASALQAITVDRKKISVLANVADKAEVIAAVKNGGEGIGLLRTEFLFLHRQHPPTEEEQVAALQDMLAPMLGKPVIIRTLDAGGDKELPYLNMPKEDNPFLGMRAIRLTLRNPLLFQQQLRAILRVGFDHDVAVMFPMISQMSELHAAKAALQEAHTALLAEGVAHKWPVSTGMMMEVPSAAIMADAFVPQVDFVSIGTNDLVQYTMAVDRGNSALQQPVSAGFDPAVILLLSTISQACTRHAVPLEVCGEAASIPALAELLIGLGVTALSMNAGAIPQMKYKIRTLSYAEMETKAQTYVRQLKTTAKDYLVW